jgi:hypothetical protein
MSGTPQTEECFTHELEAWATLAAAGIDPGPVSVDRMRRIAREVVADPEADEVLRSLAWRFFGRHGSRRTADHPTSSGGDAA